MKVYFREWESEQTKKVHEDRSAALPARGHEFKNRRGFSEAIFLYSDTDMHRVEGFLNDHGGGAARKLQASARE